LSLLDNSDGAVQGTVVK